MDTKMSTWAKKCNAILKKQNNYRIMLNFVGKVKIISKISIKYLHNLIHLIFFYYVYYNFNMHVIKPSAWGNKKMLLELLKNFIN